MSPAPAGGNLKWFDGFFDACESLGCRVDYLATHNYHGDVDLVMEELENLYLRWLIFTITRDFHDIFFNYVHQIWKEDLVNGIRSSKYP